MGNGPSRLNRATLALGLCLSLAGCGSTSSNVSEDETQTSSGGSGGVGGAADGGGSNGDGTTDGNTTHASTTHGSTTDGSGTASSGSDGSDTTTGGTGVGGSIGNSGGAGGAATSTTGGEGPACPGVEPRPDIPGTTCRSPDDCDGGEICAPDPFSGCGICVPPERKCEDDNDCGEGGHCVEFQGTEACPCTSELASECRVACAATSCGDGEECVDEVCRPRSCEDGFVCDAGFVCAPDRATSDAHGCAVADCNEGRECEPGYACDSDTGECRALHCTEAGAASCADNTECDSNTAGRGCVPKTCDVDADCDCGVCIHRCTDNTSAGDACSPGECASRLYVCGLPVPGD